MDVYEPAEDSYLLQKHVRQYAAGRILDVGTGSGIQALAVVSLAGVREVVAVDINEIAIQQLQDHIKKNKLRKIKAIQSDLFENVDGQFNLIIFNPPYLPQDKGIEDSALYGGKKGWELSERFFNEVSRYLFAEGMILFLFSSLTNKEKIEEIISHHLFQFAELERTKLAFEELYVYEIKKSSLLRELEGKGIENIHYVAQGKRGVIYKGAWDKSKLVKSHFPSRRNIITVAIKTKKAESKAEGRIANEAKWLPILNKKGIGPSFQFSGDNYLVYGFVEGEFIIDWIKHHSKEEIKNILREVLEQCFMMDQLRVNKEEMHHPVKHIIVTKDNTPVLIDFERCHETEQPQNVTQFVEFICRLQNELHKKDVVINPKMAREQAKEYKEELTRSSFQALLQALFWD